MIKWPWSTEEKEVRPDISASRKNLLWYPHAKIQDLKMKTRGEYANKYPQGAVVHFTASPDDPLGVLNWGRESGFCYFVIDRGGEVYQSFPLNEWGYHAGESYYLNRTGVSKYFVGIEVISAGRLTPIPPQPKGGEETKYAAWFHFLGNTTVLKKDAKLFTREQVRFSMKDQNIQAGIYDPYTTAQEESLTGLLLWLKFNNPEVFSFSNVIGHDECAPLRKQDPGGALSMSMSLFRGRLESLYGGHALS